MIIEEHLEKTGKSSISNCEVEVEKIEMNIPVAIRQQYVSIVEYRLRQYYQANKRKHWLNVELQKVKPKEPKVTAEMELTAVSGRSGFPHSSTEHAVMSMFDRAERLQDEIWEVEDQLYPMEKAMRCLDPDQLMLIEAKYFCREEALDEYLMNNFNWYRAKYYLVKKNGTYFTGPVPTIYLEVITREMKERLKASLYKYKFFQSHPLMGYQKVESVG